MRGSRFPSLLAALVLTIPVAATAVAMPVAASTPEAGIYENRTLPGGEAAQTVDGRTQDENGESVTEGWDELGAKAQVLVVSDPCAEGDAYLVRVDGEAGTWSEYGLGPLGDNPFDGGDQGSATEENSISYMEPRDDGDGFPSDGYPGDELLGDADQDPLEDHGLMKDHLDDWIDERWRFLRHIWPDDAGNADEDASTDVGPEGQEEKGVTAEQADWWNVSSCGSVNGDNADQGSPSDFANEGLDIWTPKACGWVEWLAAPVRVSVALGKAAERAGQMTPCRVLYFARVPQANRSLVDGTPPVDRPASDSLGRRPGIAYGGLDDAENGERDTFGSGVLGQVAALTSQTVVGSGAWSTARAVGYAVAGLSLAAFALYRRLSEDDILDNDLRVRMLEIVEDEPGINASALAREIDVAVTTILYHGRVLDEAGHLDKRKVGGEVRFLTTDQGETIVEREVVCALDQQGKGDLLTLLAEESGLNISEAARRLDRNRSTVKRHADDLVERGLVEDGRDGRSRTLSLPSEVRQVVEAGS